MVQIRNVAVAIVLVILVQVSVHAEVVELWGDQVINNTKSWSDNHYKIHGNLKIGINGQLNVEDSAIEIVCSYDREFGITIEGILRTTDCTIGGTKKNLNIIHSNFHIEGGWWYATDTMVQYSYGIGFHQKKPSYLRAMRLTAGVSSDSILIGNRADVILEDSVYPINVKLDASDGGTTTLEFPTDTPFTGIFDWRNCPGAEYRMELINTRVIMWFLWISGVSSDGPITTYNLRNCPSLLISMSGHNIKETASLPACFDAESREWYQYLPANTHISFGSVRFNTLNDRVNLTCWSLYLNGDETNVTITGRTNIAELQVRQGALCRVIGNAGTHNAYLSCTTVDAFHDSKVLVRNATLSNPDIFLNVGQISAHDMSSIAFEDCIIGHILLVPRDGDIDLVDCYKYAPGAQATELKGDGRVSWYKSMVCDVQFSTDLQDSLYGWVGTKIQIGDRALCVERLGRYMSDGNQDTYEMRIIRARDKQNLGSAWVNMGTGDPDKNGFKYGWLQSQVVLDPNEQYYIMCRELDGQDSWCDFDSRIVTRPEVIVLASVSSSDLQRFDEHEQGSYGGGPVNMLYVMEDLDANMAWYRFDEGRGDIVCDSVGCSDGYLKNMGDDAWILAHEDHALDFDGMNDYLRIPRFVPGDFTISFWLKTTSSGSGVSGNSWWSGAGLIDSRLTELEDGFGISLIQNQIAFGVGEPYSTIMSGRHFRGRSNPIVNVTDGQWHHITATRMAVNGQMNLYVDRQPEAVGIGPTGEIYVGQWVRVGSLQGNTNFFRGQMDELRLYYNVLDQEQIRELAGVVYE